ncbi:A-kinase anchor protein 10, mitochondrial [Aplysia californica]|uniref:A-kinase anchor protein 10, mitochondrial n=1 Tax=Aplysia californica TaxID=6500 RepID=A0ABM0K142_APLCA|nr:A-kinase anchor protein 10, mitochondrial [Aplysia californica]
MMSFFRRKSEKQKSAAVKLPSSLGSGLKRTPSNRSNKSLPQSPDTPDSWNEENDIGVVSNGSASGLRRPRTLCLSETVLQDGKDIPENSLESPMRTSSRLSKTLLEVVRDQDALSCLKSFLRSQNAESLLQFWCDAESFHAATLTRRRTHSLQHVSKGSLHKRRSGSVLNAASNQESGPSPSPASPAIDPVMGDSLDRYDSQTATPSSRVGGGEEKSGHGLSTTVANAADPHQHGCKEELLSNPPVVALPQAQAVNSCGKDGARLPDGSADTLTRKPPEEISEKCPEIEDIASSLRAGSERLAAGSKVPAEAGSLSDSVPRPQQTPTAQSPSGRDGELISPQHPHTESGDESGKVDGSSGDLTSPTSSQEDLATKLKKSIERDAVTIFSTYIAKDAPRPIGVNDLLRSEAISRICREDGEVDPECFVSCQRFVLDKIDAQYFPGFRDSEHHCSHQAHVLTTERIYLPDILLNENALCYFMEYMEQEGGSDLMQLWLAADNFQQQLSAAGPGYDWEQAQNDAMVIYDRYFSLQATHPVGFDDKLRFEVEGNICREGGPLPDCFTKAKNIVLKILEKMYFPGYLQSQVYHRYLSDLVSTVQMAEDMHNKPYHKVHRRTESDASSEHSIGSQSTGAESMVSRNTLLAVDTRRVRKGGTGAAGPIVGDFSMTPEMFNPDDLWKRPSAGDLSLGCVNELGQFVSQFEQGVDQDRRKGSGFFKKWKEKEKEQEEMALRVAQMIISDVNTMTKTGETMMENHS